MAMLTVMPYDRCVAICLPSSALWNHHECQHLYSWNLSHLDQWGHLWSYAYICYFLHHFYGANIIYKLFCNISQLLKLTCSNEYFGELGVTGFLSLMAFLCFISIWFTQSHTHAHKETHILYCVEVPICWGQSKGLFHLPPPPAIIILFVSTGVLWVSKATYWLSNCIRLYLKVKVTQSCLTLCDPMD